MLDFIKDSILWILALYGLFEIIKSIVYIFTLTKLRPNGIYTIIAVKNKEEEIEGFLRSFLFKYIYNSDETFQNVIITDLGSTDTTKKILTKLEKDNRSDKGIRLERL